MRRNGGFCAGRGETWQVFAGCDERRVSYIASAIKKTILASPPYSRRRGIVMNRPVSYSRLNEAKMDFTDLYMSKDPRKYFKYL
jgi:hypothetical protein